MEALEEENTNNQERREGGHHHEAQLPAFEEGKEERDKRGDEGSECETHFLASGCLDVGDVSGDLGDYLVGVVLIIPGYLLVKKSLIIFFFYSHRLGRSHNIPVVGPKEI